MSGSAEHAFFQTSFDPSACRSILLLFTTQKGTHSMIDKNPTGWRDKQTSRSNTDPEHRRNHSHMVLGQEPDQSKSIHITQGS